MRKVFRFLSGIIIGAFFGGLFGILLAPTSGNNLRQWVNNYIIETSNEIRLAAQQKRAELEQELAALRGPKPN